MANHRCSIHRNCRHCGKSFLAHGPREFWCCHEHRFWSKVDKSDRPNGCWEWTGYRNADGYGSFRMVSAVNGWVLAHRFSFETRHRLLLSGELVLHKCDNPPCVRPDHLEGGDHLKNMTDAFTRGRLRDRDYRGEKHPSVKLTEKNVLEILRIGRSVPIKETARRFGVSKYAISDVINGRSWRHITCAPSRSL